MQITFILNAVLLVIFSLLCAVFIFTINRQIFVFQAGVIRESTTFTYSLTITLIAFIILFFIQGFTKPVPLWLFTLNNLAYVVRIVNEYFYQRTRNLTRTLAKHEQAAQFKNELITKVVNSPAEEDISIIHTAVVDDIKRTRGLLAVQEHGITGAIIYTREGNLLQVNSLEHIYGFCVPITRLEVLKLYKTIDQFNEIIMRMPFEINTITQTPKELLPSWGEKLIKEVLETKKELVTAQIPGELKGVHTLVALYPIFDKDHLDGMLVIFKDDFNKFFPEEENTLVSIVDQLAVIFSIIKGKQLQRERNRLQGEMEIARQIQTSILPKKIIIDGYECASVMTTASEVGGDVYDCFKSSFGTYLGIGDVSGHGLPAGVTALIQLTAFQAALLTAQAQNKRLEPDELYELINKILCEINRDRIGSDKFMTENIFLIKDGTFTYAGTHLIALQYFKNQNTVAELDFLINRTAFMGLCPTISAKESKGEFSLAQNDLLLLYTDGIIEAKDHLSRQFGLKRLKEILSASAALPLEDICDHILKAVHEHAKTGDMKKYKGNLADDASLVLIRKL